MLSLTVPDDVSVNKDESPVTGVDRAGSCGRVMRTFPKYGIIALGLRVQGPAVGSRIVPLNSDWCSVAGVFQLLEERL